MDMPASRPVPLIRASVIQPFLEAAKQIGTPVTRFMHAAGLPTEPMSPDEHPTLLLPEIPCWKLTRLIARHEGVDDFGLMAARSIAHHDISTIAPLIADCVTLKQLLERVMEIAPLHAASGRYIVERQHNLVFFIQRGERWMEGDVQVQLFQLAGMIQLVRLAAGPNWHPERVHFTFGTKTWLESTPEFGASRLYFGCRHPAIAFPARFLSLPLLEQKPADQSAKPDIPPLCELPDGFASSLRDALVPYIGSTPLRRELVTELTNLSPRTVQRRLARLGTSYSRVLDQARLKKAQTLLLDTDMKITEISLLLGYQNPPAFSRAFLRWTGLSPREYRRQLARKAHPTEDVHHQPVVLQ